MDINFECHVELCKIECNTCQKPGLVSILYIKNLFYCLQQKKRSVTLPKLRDFRTYCVTLDSQSWCELDFIPLIIMKEKAQANLETLPYPNLI